MLALPLLMGIALAQPPAKPAPTPSRPLAEKTVRAAAPTTPAREEAAEARKLLMTTAVDQLELIVDDVRSIDNLAIAIPIARAVVAKLARHRPERCRDLVTALYDRAEGQIQDNVSNLKNESVKYTYHSQLRSIINIATSFDRALSQQLIDRLESSESFSKVLNKSEGTYSAAKEMINSDPRQALQIANQAIGETFTVWGLEFLAAIRQKDPAGARDYMSRLLGSMEARKYPTIKELVFLHPYVFLTKTVPYFEPATHQLGQVYNLDYGKGLDKETVDPALAVRYTQLCVSLMLQPDRYLDIYGPLRANEADDLIFIDTFLLPAVRTYLPKALEPLQERRAALLSSMDPTLRKATSETMTNFGTNRESPRPVAEDLLQRAEDPKTSPARKTKLYFDAARLAAEKHDYARAMDLVAKVPDPMTRAQVREFVAYEIAQAELVAGKFDEARRWVMDDSDAVRKGSMLTQIANAMSQDKARDVQRLSNLLAEAETLAYSRTPGTERLVMLAGIAAVQVRTNPAQALETINRCVETANSAERIDGNLTAMRTIRLEPSYFSLRLYPSPLTFPETLRQLSREHFMPLVAMVRTLSDPIVRAKAVLAACEGVL